MRLIFEDCGLPRDVPYETTTIYSDKDGDHYRVFIKDGIRVWTAGIYDSLGKVKSVMELILASYEMDKKYCKIPNNDNIGMFF